MKSSGSKQRCESTQLPYKQCKTRKIRALPPDAIEVEAFQLALPALMPIDRLIVSAQKRLDRYLDDLERTSKANARALRLATEKGHR